MSLALRTNSYVRDPFQFFFGRPAAAFAPAFEVKETADAFVVKADLPGVAEADLDIAVHQSVLTVAGHRQAEERKEGEAFSLYERQYGAFSRSFSLPELADGEKIAAKLESGVLTLTIAKKAAAKPRKIAVNA
jgi:HSP20 family protein